MNNFLSLSLVSILSVIGISACSETGNVDEHPITNSVETKPSVSNTQSIEANDVGFSIKSNADGTVSYEGNEILSGELRVRQGYCEYCFHINDSSAKSIPKPRSDIDTFVVAIRSEKTGILDLGDDNDKCYSMPLTLELTGYNVDLDGLESFHSAEIKRVVEKGEVTESECDFELI